MERKRIAELVLAFANEVERNSRAATWTALCGPDDSRVIAFREDRCVVHRDEYAHGMNP